MIFHSPTLTAKGASAVRGVEETTSCRYHTTLDESLATQVRATWRSHCEAR